ncbi:peptide-methionine (S)-S-oxide reductase MsrA [Leptothoe kymatousa]|uniref:Peptide methionine sulfoxide reductase MsrA n=1 Tax=Leptothoe kymatousa TAU-MAC 1615 TaxID=2364775 RepID=A0ABS5Y6L5_9CYAN|nr:peptide-methionine (S)-S-oxide reductase MsrA [Leptothoe kymatousa]MBT9313504.1 peptide-methionine (S)-S-oxide reductase MsrA [Leptothoe kymatousa TAU-MAC 1615]
MDASLLATFGAGCFWGTENAFRQLKGVSSTSVGYMGGHFENPCYLDVLSRITGHAEVAQIQYDPSLITYGTLLETFWHMHDPTSLNRQGADRGEQYRSVIFYHTDQQQQLAQQSKRAMTSNYSQPIVTQIVAASAYWLATEEHQQYFEKKSFKKSP